MTITRDGMKIQLTPEEVLRAWEEQKNQYLREDLALTYESGIFTDDDIIPDDLNEEELEQLYKRATSILDDLYADNSVKNSIYNNAKIEALARAWKEIKDTLLVKKPLQSYHVNFVVDGRFNVNVDASSREEAVEKAQQIFEEADLGELEVVNSFCQYSEDEVGNMVEYI